MIKCGNEAIIPGVTVSRILEVRSVEQTRDQEGIEEPTIGDMVLDKTSTEWGITSDKDYTDDYHSGLVRAVPRDQSNFLTRERGMDDLMIWNERAVSVCIAQELAIVAQMLEIERTVRSTKADALQKATGLDISFLGSSTAPSIAEAVVAVAVGCNIVLDDPGGDMRDLMNNGNTVGFIGRVEPTRPALIVSSYNSPCAKPGRRLIEMFPTIFPTLVGLAPLDSDYPNIDKDTLALSYTSIVKAVLGPYHGWVGGIHSPGVVSVGDMVFVNQVPTTPPLPESEA